MLMKGLDGKPLGVIQAVNKHAVLFSENDIALVQLLAEQAGGDPAAQPSAAGTGGAGAAARDGSGPPDAGVLIPRSPPVFPGYDAGGRTSPAGTTGADCLTCGSSPMGGWDCSSPTRADTACRRPRSRPQRGRSSEAVSEIEPDPHRVLGP